MNRKSIRVVFVLALIFIGGLQAAHAEVWDAYTQYNTTGVQSSTDVWQYLSMPGQTGNGPYTPMATYLDVDLPPLYHLWGAAPDFSTTYYAKISTWPDIRSDFGADVTGSLAWRSPIDGFVDLTFTVRKQLDGGDGANYALYRDTDSTPLASGSIGGAVNSTTGPISFTNVPVSQGTTFYLNTAPGSGIAYDTLGVTFTVTQVPEPGTIAILCSGLAGLLVFVRRKLK